MSNPDKKESRLIPILREGIGVVQMIFFKECKLVIQKKYPEQDVSTQAMLAGAVTNELFGSQNLEKKFQDFRAAHQGEIEQELLSLSNELPSLIPALTDALRIQTLCDNQEGIDSEHILKQAGSCNILSPEQELPLPSAFMATVRNLGAQYNLIIAPVEINETEEQTLLQ